MNPEYNICKIAGNTFGQKPFLGKKHTQETKNKMSKSQIGKKLGPLKKETKLKLSLKFSGKNNPMYGKHHSEESKNKNSNSQKNLSKETRNKITKGKRSKSRFDINFVNGMRFLYEKENWTVNEITNFFNENRKTIDKIIHYRIWKIYD